MDSIIRNSDDSSPDIKDTGRSGIRHASLLVRGMTCATCALRVEKSLKAVPDILDAQVNPLTNRADVEWTGNDISLLHAAVEAAGYEAFPWPKTSKARTTTAQKTQEDIDNSRYEVILLIVGVILSSPLVASMIAGMAGTPFHLSGWIQLLLATPIQFWIGAKFHKNAWNALKAGTGNMDTLIVMGSSAAYFFSLAILSGFGDKMSSHLYFEASAIIIIAALLGRTLETGAKRNTTSALSGLMALSPQTAKIMRKGMEVEIPIEEVINGDIVVIRPGERIPVDGKIVEGHSQTNESMITGESMPVKKNINDPVTGGSLNGSGLLHVCTTRTGENSTLAKIIKLVENAQYGKAPIQRLTDRISTIFVPVIIVIAIATFTGWMIFNGSPEQAIIAAVSVLVIACPCAVGLAAPTVIMVGTGVAAKAGILFRDVSALEQARNVNTVIFDKTGSLTIGRPVLNRISGIEGKEKELVRAAASLQSASEHPLAKAILEKARNENISLVPVKEFESHAGFGISGLVNEQKVIMGNRTIMEVQKIEIPEKVSNTLKLWEDEGDTTILIAVNGKISGLLSMSDSIRKEASKAIGMLKSGGINPVMLTGDNPHAARTIALKAGIEQFRAESSPQEKAKFIEKLQERGKVVAMVGDGVNDTPALALADTGIAMGSGSDIAMETADIILMRSNLLMVYETIQLSGYVWRKLWQNLFWAFIYNLIGIPLAIMGALNPAIAGIAMALSSFSVVVNSLTLRLWKPENQGQYPYTDSNIPDMF